MGIQYIRHISYIICHISYVIHIHTSYMIYVHNIFILRIYCINEWGGIELLSMNGDVTHMYGDATHMYNIFIMVIYSQ